MQTTAGDRTVGSFGVPSDTASSSQLAASLWQKNVTDGEISSAKRLQGLTARGLSPRFSVSNHTNAFIDHLLAIGVVEGIYDASNACADGKGFGPQLHGFSYSEEESRFETPQTIFTFVNTGNSGRRTLNVSHKTLPDTSFAVRCFDPDYVPTAKQRRSGTKAATASDPATRVLVFDFDRKHYPQSVIDTEVIDVCRILHHAGVYNWIVDVSSGGYHVLAMLNQPVLLSEVSVLFRSIKDAFRTLDIQPMIGVNGAISVPFSKSKSGDGHRVLAHPINRHFVAQKRVNAFTRWEQLHEALLNQFRIYDMANQGRINSDLRAEKLSRAATEKWNAAVLSFDGSALASGSAGHADTAAMERQRLAAMNGKVYKSASEERFAVVGHMVAIHGSSDAATERIAERLQNSSDPLPTHYRELVARSSRKPKLHTSITRDLRSMRERGSTGTQNAGFRTTGMEPVALTDKTAAVVQRLLEKIAAGTSYTYTQLAVLRSHLHFANARHREHLDAAETGQDEPPADPFRDAVPFALSMVTRMTGLAHSTTYDNTMSCSQDLTKDEDFIAACRRAGAEHGLFCLCHPEWEDFFSVEHLGHAGSGDEYNRAHECRNPSYCTHSDGSGRERASNHLIFRSYPVREFTDAERSSWVYQYLTSRDPIFNEGALGSAGFHAYHLISRSTSPVYTATLREHKLAGAAVEKTVEKLIDAGLIGRSSAKGSKASFTFNAVEDGSLFYRLRHERRAHAVDQKVQFKSAMMGTASINEFVLQFTGDLPRLYFLVRQVLRYRDHDDNGHAPARLTDTDGNIITSVAQFRAAYDLPALPKNAQDAFLTEIGDDAEDKVEVRSLGDFKSLEGIAERWRGQNLFQRLNHRDDFLAAVEELSAMEHFLFGNRFVPSRTLAEMFDQRRKDFLFDQDCIAEYEQKHGLFRLPDPPGAVLSTAA